MDEGNISPLLTQEAEKRLRKTLRKCKIIFVLCNLFALLNAYSYFIKGIETEKPHAIPVQSKLIFISTKIDEKIIYIRIIHISVNIT